MTFSWYPLFATTFTAPTVDLVEEARTVGRAASRESPRRATVEVDREVEAVAVVMAVLNIIYERAIVLFVLVVVLRDLFEMVGVA